MLWWVTVGIRWVATLVYLCTQLLTTVLTFTLCAVQKLGYNVRKVQSFTVQIRISNRIQVMISVYRQYRILVDDEDAQHAESDWLTVQTTQKYIYLYSYTEETLRNYAYTV